MGGIAISASLTTYLKYLDLNTFTNGLVHGHSNAVPNHTSKHDKKFKMKNTNDTTTREYVAMFFVALVSLFLVTYAMHCVWATSEAYSSPSIVLSGKIVITKNLQSYIFIFKCLGMIEKRNKYSMLLPLSRIQKIIALKNFYNFNHQKRHILHSGKKKNQMCI